MLLLLLLLLTMMFMLQLVITLLVMDRMPVLQGFWILTACPVITEKLYFCVTCDLIITIIYYIGWLYHPQLRYNTVFINPQKK